MPNNGDTLTEAEAVRQIERWLPLLSDRARGQLRARLIQASLVCSERESAPVGSKVVTERPRPTEMT